MLNLPLSLSIIQTNILPTLLGSDYVPPALAEEGQETPLFGTTTAKATTPLFTMPPENMVIPDPAVLAGMPPPPVLPNFANMSINGMPTPPVAPPVTTSDNSQPA